ncbi:hypothetical protein NDU88_005846 [Pleurodeles waltl]|uniref:Uncharacterized protein n=1 Tax=Pleurodeles waltl TaxID=8319 RepID=A0AAV7UJ65_PLEWA|nr:hypothetical protein NDU88_005846 [Pleurodeles waltl]
MPRVPPPPILPLSVAVMQLDQSCVKNPLLPLPLLEEARALDDAQPLATKRKTSPAKEKASASLQLLAPPSSASEVLNRTFLGA